MRAFKSIRAAFTEMHKVKKTEQDKTKLKPTDIC